MGLVAYRGRWRRPDVVGEKVKDDAQLNAALAEYNGRREKAANTADAQWRLAALVRGEGLASRGVGPPGDRRAAGPKSGRGMEATGLQEAQWALDDRGADCR